MASRIGRFSTFRRKLFGNRPAPIYRGSVGKQFVELESRAVPATFIVTNILDSLSDVTGGLSLRSAINAANANPGFDRIEFNIPRSPALPTLPNDPTENYYPIVLASTLPTLTDPAGVSIDASTQPRNNPNGTRPIVQLLPDPNPAAFPGSIGAFLIKSANNSFRGMVLTGFPGAAFNVTSPTASNNIFVGNWINTDITGLKSWNQDPILLAARPPGTPPELTNTGPNPLTNPLFVLAGMTFTDGANNNIIGGVVDKGGVPLIDAGGKFLGTGGTLFRYNSKGVLTNTGIPITPEINRNVISGTPEFRKDYYNYVWALDGSIKVRQREVPGAGIGPGIRIMDPDTANNLIQGNFIGTDVTGNGALPNHNGIEIMNSATSNMIGNPLTNFVGDPVAAGYGNLIRFNENDGVRIAQTPNPSQINPPPPPVPGPPQPYQEGYDAQTATTSNANPNGAFGPGGSAAFFDAFNPNYFVGISTAGGDVLVIGNTDDTGTTNPGIYAQVGEKVTINGSGLLSTTSVTFTSQQIGQTVPSKFTIEDDNTLTVIVPAGAATGTIRVFTPAGFATTAGTILPSAPTEIEQVETYSPSRGTAGTKVTIFGTGFTGTQTIAFGGVLATSFTVAPGGKSIEVIVPTGALTGPITITTPGGSVSTPNRPFTVLTQPPPFVAAASPPAGIPGQEITLTGTNFTGAYLVTFNYSVGGGGFSTTDLVVDSPTQIRVKIPRLATASTGPIRVTTSDGFGVGVATFQILTPAAPTIASVSSSTGPIGTILTITGNNFTSANRVTIGGVDATKFTILNGSTITATVPGSLPLNAAATIRVISTGGTATGPTFTPVASPAPTIGSIPFANRNTFTVVNGTNLLGTTKVLFGNPTTGTPAPSFEVLSDTQIRIQIPAAVASTGSFFLYTAYNTQTSPNPPPAQNTFSVANSPFPTIGFGRLSDPISGTIGSLVTLRGQGFIGTQDVRFLSSLGAGQTVSATELTIVSDSEITFRVPQLAVSGPITVISPGSPDPNFPFDPADPTEVTTTPFSYTVVASPVPVIETTSPLSGTVGALIILNGSGFLGTSQVTVGGAVANFEIVNDTSIKVRVPELAQTGLVTITTPGGTASSSSNYTVIASGAPFISFSSARAARNTQVTIAGANLAGTTRVSFNNIPAEFTVISDGLITAIVPVNATPGEIRVDTVGGSIVSPTPFNLDFVTAPVVSGAVNEISGPVGTKVFVNGTNLEGVFRVEVGGASSAFEILGNSQILLTIPEINPGTYSITVYASDKNNPQGGNLGNGSNAATSYFTATNILGTVFEYGNKLTVLPSARPVITGTELLDGAPSFERGAPFSIRGTGFTGATLVNIAGIDLTPDLFTVVGDTRIDTHIPIADLPGIAAIDDQLIQVFTPHGKLGDPTDDLVSLQTGTEAQIDIVATADLVYSTKTVTTVAGATITFTATSGTFYGVSNLFVQFAKDNSTPTQVTYATDAPFHQTAPLSGPTLDFQNFTIVPGSKGKSIQAVVPTNMGKIPTPVGDPTPATLANLTIAATNNKGDIVMGSIVKLVELQAPQTSAVTTSSSTGTFDTFHNTYTLVGPLNDINLIGISKVKLTFTPDVGPVFIDRDNLEVFIAQGRVRVSFKLPALHLNPFDPTATTNFPTGQLEAISDYGSSTQTFTPIAQQVPTLVTLTSLELPPQDNRINVNRVYDNGMKVDATTGKYVPKTEAEKFTDGVLGIDFVTQLTGAGTFPFQYGFAHQQQGAQTSPYPAGNQGKGGLNDGVLNSFTLQPGTSALPGTPAFASVLPGSIGFEIDRASGAYQIIGKNSFNNVQYGRYFGPNLLQNFPLVQVVQSTADRTTFSTALIAKPFRTYRIDYYYTPGVNNPLTDAALDPFLSTQPGFTGTTRFDDDSATDPTARKTSNVGSGQVYLGSKFITTDASGDGSVSFDIFRRLPTDPNDPNSIPAPTPGDFYLPNNQPLAPSVIDPVTGNVLVKSGVVTTTATDMTAPTEQGPTTVTGPDGSSRFSYFKRVDTSTAGITGRVVLDANQNKQLDAGEGGVDKAKVDIFLQKADLTYNASPSLTVITPADGSFAFNSSTGGGLGLPAGDHKIVVTLPTGGTVTYFFEEPANGQQTVTILGGETVNNVNFFVTDAPQGTAPTISDIGNQNVTPGTTVGPLAFTVNDAETPAANLVVTATSSNPGFVPNSNITLSGTGNNRFITVTTPAGVIASTVITVTVTDGNGLTASDQFVINTASIGANTPPTISPIANQTLQAGVPSSQIAFTVADAESTADTLVVTRATSNSGIVPLSGIVLGGTGTNRTVTITSAAGIIGSAVITLTVTDIGGLSSQTQFTVTVPPAPGTAPALLAVGSDAGRVAQVNVYNPNNSLRYVLTPYGDNFTGGVRVSTGDVTGDGNADVIVAPGIGIAGLVKIYEGVTGAFLQQFLPYGDAFKGGVYVVTGDVDGDGIRDIVTGTGRGGGPRVRVLRGGGGGSPNTASLESLADFFPYESNFRGGVLVAAGDVNGDGKADVVTGTGPGGGPRVRVVDGTNLSSTPGVGTLYDFFAYDNRVRGGVFATVGDVDGDNIPEILTGPGAGGPAVKIFKQSDISPGAPTFDVNGSQQFLASKSFFAYDPTFNGGVRVDIVDGNNDGIPDIVTGPGVGVGPDVRVINYATLQDIYRIQAFESTFKGGLFVGGNLPD